MEKVNYFIQHRAVFVCCNCGAVLFEVLGEDIESNAMGIKCSYCGYEFELLKGA